MRSYPDVDAIRAVLTGPVPSISTPFQKSGAIDWNALRTMVHFLLDSGAKALLITPGDSLFSILEDTEIYALNQFVVREAAEQALVITAGRATWLGQMQTFATCCAQAGAQLFIPFMADWVGSVGAEELVDFFEQAGQIMPYMVLTNMGGGGRGVPAQTFAHLLRRHSPGFVAVKDDIGGAYGVALAQMLDGSRVFLTGGTAGGHLAYPARLIDAFLGIFARFWPQVDQLFWRRFQAGDNIGARAIVDSYEKPLLNFFQEIGLHFDAGIHACLEWAGLAQRWRRNPYTSATDEQMALLNDWMQRMQRRFQQEQERTT